MNRPVPSNALERIAERYALMSNPFSSGKPLSALEDAYALGFHNGTQELKNYLAELEGTRAALSRVQSIQVHVETLPVMFYKDIKSTIKCLNQFLIASLSSLRQSLGWRS